ncbi:diaminopropionate ammonia-lyase [Mycobacterium sp. 155]|uniref:diaminopropionate ammonia-lyase n=1 Tax=Mycobacterium sp. 155 TaxID=1157943 RepID=UPI000369C1D7|nr:diaminopropionate ammonia-lyase [Mycobacterium sp. 155]
MTLTTYINPDVDVTAALAAASALLTPEAAEHAWDTITSWPEYSRTPLISRPDVAKRARVGEILVKDESLRSELRSFKSLGGAYAVQLAYQRWQARRDATPFVASCVTDGNHGLSVAWGAKNLGVECIVYVPAAVSQARADAIAAQGATVTRIDMNYDEVTELHTKDAEANGWAVITDTAPRADTPLESVVDVMNGYSVLARELADELAEARPTHVLMQAGCGGMAGAIMPAMLRVVPEAKFVVVEPERAACLQASARAGEITVVTGDLHTRMIGMSVGETSRPTWPIIHAGTTGYVACGDGYVDEAMRMLGRPENGYTAIESGETGCAGLVALLELSTDDEARRALGLDESSRVVIINTEGATDAQSYRAVMA